MRTLINNNICLLQYTLYSYVYLCWRWDWGGSCQLEHVYNSAKVSVFINASKFITFTNQVGAFTWTALDHDYVQFCRVVNMKFSEVYISSLNR